MEQSELISKFVDDIIDGKNQDAKSSFEDVISIKVTDALDQRKQDLAQSIFNKEQEDDTGDSEDSGDVSSSEEQA